MPSLIRPRLALLPLLLTVACSTGDPRDMGMEDAQVDAGPIPDEGPFFPDGAVPCAADEECDDGVECTLDECVLPNGFCRNITRSELCQDEVFCNGAEVCDPIRGCIEAPNVVTCDDQDVCTIDRCIEEMQMCLRVPRDIDQDGDVDANCGGSDCDDRNPRRNGQINEVCEDGIDNDCDDFIDELECGAPPNDDCTDPLDVSAGGFFLFPGVGTSNVFTTSCLSFSAIPDMVATFTLTENRSVTLEAEASTFMALELRSGFCEDPSPEDPPDPEPLCQTGFPPTVVAPDLPPGEYFVIMDYFTRGDIGLRVTFGDPILPPENDTCETAEDVGTGGTFESSFLQVEDDYDTECGLTGAPDLVYEITLDDTQDVVITTSTDTGDSLRFALRETCDSQESELLCTQRDGRFYSLEAGTYFLILEGPTFRDPNFELDVEILPPTDPPAGDSCDSPIVVMPGVSQTGTFSGLQDDLDPTCSFLQDDVVFEFTLDEGSEVSVELNSGGFGALTVQNVCTDNTTEIVCGTGSPSSIRLPYLEAGTYFAIGEATGPRGYTFNFDSTPRDAPTAVTGSDDCDNATVIPETGGLFTGSTLGNTNTYETNFSCGGSGSRSEDVAFELTLTEEKRVIATTVGSSFDTVLHRHEGTCTSLLESACNDDADFTDAGDWGALDEVLPAGTYYYIVDGFFIGRSGDYFLEVTIEDPPPAP